MPDSPTIIDAGSVKVEPLALSMAAGAKVIGVSLRTFAQLVADEKIRSFKLGSRRLVTLQAIRDFLTAAEGRP